MKFIGEQFIVVAAAALAVAATPVSASASDMLSVGVASYMEQWVGYAGSQSASEVYVRTALESDMGLRYTVHVEVEGDRGSNSTGDTIDESQFEVNGSFGQIVLGTDDHSAALMHHSNRDMGVSGYLQQWIEGAAYPDTDSSITDADDRKVSYIAPRLMGLQIGLSHGTACYGGGGPDCGPEPAPKPEPPPPPPEPPSFTAAMAHDNSAEASWHCIVCCPPPPPPPPCPSCPCPCPPEPPCMWSPPRLHQGHAEIQLHLLGYEEEEGGLGGWRVTTPLGPGIARIYQIGGLTDDRSITASGSDLNLGFGSAGLGVGIGAGGWGQ